MNSTCAPSVAPEMLSNCDLESPTQEAFSLLNTCSSADWNLLLQDGQTMVATPERNDFTTGVYPMPMADTGWNAVPNPTSTTSCMPLYNQPVAPPHPVPPTEQHLQAAHPQMMTQYSITVENQNKKLRHDFMSSSQPSLDQNTPLSRSNEVNDSRQCAWSCQYQAHSDLDSGKTQFFTEIDVRYDLPRLSDFNPEANMINLTGSVTSDILKVVDSDDEESDIIVEDSDTESEISVTVIDDDPPIGCSSDLSCIVCDVSCRDVAAVNFVHINSTFPLTFVSKTPVVMKLIEFIPFDFQNLVKFENTLICRRCLNLIDTAENLEYRLTNIKQELCNFISKCKPLIGGEMIPQEPTQPRLPCLYQQNLATPCPTTFSPPVVPRNVDIKDDENHSEGSEIDIEDNKTETKPVEQTADLIADTAQSQKQIESEFKADAAPVKSDLKKDRKKGRYQCDRCGRTYLNKDKFSAHMVKHNTDFIFKCQHCYKGFTLEPFLQIHLRSHKDLRKFQCPDCPASFIQESDFKLHSCSELEKRFMCNECPVAFRTKAKLEEHTAANHNKDKHVCEECSKEFKNASSLAAHMKSHTDEREFKCDLCQASYKSSSHLNRHVSNSHNQEKKKLEVKNNAEVDKKFECSQCGKHFADKRYLKQHKNIHDGNAKLNTCPICNKTFRISLKIHMTSHSTKKMFKCGECGSEFAYKQGLMKHVRLKHKKNESIVE